MQAVFYGVGACVIGIITLSAYKLTTRTIGKLRLLWTIYLVSAAVTVVTEKESIWLFLAAGAIVWLVRTPPGFLRRKSPSASAAAGLIGLPFGFSITGASESVNQTLLTMALFYAKAGAFVFGSGLAIVPFLYSGVVKEMGWLSEKEFLDAVAVAMITPGPVVITVGFIGYITGVRTEAGGFTGATVAAVATFLPCYLLTIIPAPYFKKHGKRPGLVSFVDGVTAATVGAIAGSVVVLGRRTIFEHGWYPEIPKVVLLFVTIGLMWRFKKLPEPIIVLGAAVIGLLIYPLVRS
jgi:chromate transporter